jgi:hypothetical protein
MKIDLQPLLDALQVFVFKHTPRIFLDALIYIFLTIHFLILTCFVIFIYYSTITRRWCIMQ